MKKEVVLILGIMLIFGILGVVSAERIGIDTGNSYVPGENVKIKITLYDDASNKIQGTINYKILNYYSETVQEGSINSGEEITYQLPSDAYQGPWKIIASYNSIEANTLFNVGQSQKAEIKIEGDTLILKNVGNSVYDKKILIYIGQQDQTAQVYLDIGQEKRIRLTAPTGTYDVRVIEGNEENTLEFKGVGLTGNVIGLESVLGGGNFWQKYPVVILFLGALLLVVIVVVILKGRNRGINISIVNKNINKNINKNRHR